MLTKLDLTENEHLDAAAVEELVKGGWPLLEELILADCSIGLAGSQHLVRSSWTRLLQSPLAGCSLCTSSTSQCSGMQLLWDQLPALYKAPTVVPSSPFKQKLRPLC